MLQKGSRVLVTHLCILLIEQPLSLTTLYFFLTQMIKHPYMYFSPSPSPPPFPPPLSFLL